MPTALEIAKDRLLDFFFGEARTVPPEGPPDFSSSDLLVKNLVTGIGIGTAPPPQTDPPSPQVPEQLLIFVEPVPDCVLEKLWNLIKDETSEPFLFLKTGRFYGLLGAPGESISVHAPQRYNIPPVSAGTFGAIVQANNNRYILGSNHVIAFNGRALGADVAAPGTLDDTTGGMVVGTVSNYVELHPPAFPNWTWGSIVAPPPPARKPPLPAPNTVDCAVAEFTPAAAFTVPSPHPLALATLPASGFVDVQKTGRTTGLTRSQICIRSCNHYIDLSFGTYYFGGLMAAFGIKPGTPRHDAFAAPGDSGALVLTDTANSQGVGLLMARAYCSGVYAGPPPVTGIPPGFFVGYIILMCDLHAVANELGTVLGHAVQFFR